MVIPCVYLLSICVFLLQLVPCIHLPRHNITTTLPLKSLSGRPARNRSGIALAITRELALRRAWDSKALAKAKHRKYADSMSRIDEILEFYAIQHDKILRGLVLPTIASQEANPRDSEKQAQRDNVFDWEVAISTEEAPLQCAVLASVPPGTALIRPKIKGDDVNPGQYISVHALNSLVRTQPGFLKLIFPYTDQYNLEKLYSRASLGTYLVSPISCSPGVRRILSLMLVTSFTIASHRLLLDMFFSIIRLKAVWHPQIYSLWSRIYHTPTPMMILTVKKVFETLLEFLSYIDEYILDYSLNLEGFLLNSDIQRSVLTPVLVEDSKGRQRQYETCFNPPTA